MRTNGRNLTLAEHCSGYARRVSRPAGREQNWYPISMLGWFTSHIREGVAVTRPCVLEDATVAPIIRVRRAGGAP